MKMYITMCGRQQKISQMGMASTMFGIVEKFWGDDVFAKAASLSEQNAYDKIRSQIIKLNPQAEP